MYKRIEGSMINVNHIARVYGEILDTREVEGKFSLDYKIVIELSNGNEIKTRLRTRTFDDSKLVEMSHAIKLQQIKNFLDEAVEFYIRVHIEGER